MPPTIIFAAAPIPTAAPWRWCLTWTPARWPIGQNCCRNLAQHTGTDTAGDGSTLGTIASQKLADLYKDMAKHSGSDPACADALKDTELNFILWPDAKQDGLTVQPAGLPHVIASCGPAMTLPVKTLKTLDVNAGLLDAIEAAHQGH